MSALSAAILADSPILYWRMNTLSGAESDLGSGGHTLTYTGSPARGVQGIVPTDTDACVRFAAGSQYGSTPNVADLTFTSFPFSMACWVRFDSINAGGSQEFIAKGSFGNGGWEFRNRLGVFTLSYIGVADIISNFRPQVGIVYNFGVAARASGNTDFYVNGSKIFRSTTAGTPITNAQDCVLAQDSLKTGTDPLLGCLDEVSVYNTGLSDARFAAYWDAGNLDLDAQTALVLPETSQWKGA